MNKKLKKILKKTFLYTIWSKLRDLKNYYKSDDYYFMTKRFPVKRYGKLNSDRVLFVINDANPHSGILSEWFQFLKVYNYSILNGYTPVVDLKNYYMPLIGDRESVGKENVWEFYFKQPNCFNFSEVYKSRKVIIAPSLWNKNYNQYDIKETEWNIKQLFDFSKTELKKLKDYYKVSPLSNEITELATDYKNRFFPKTNEKILGVSFRREYERNHVYNNPTTPIGTHPVKATLETIIPDIENALKKTKYRYFFLTVDDREACDKIKEYFGDRCIITDRKLCHNFENNIPLKLDYKNVLDDKVLVEYNGIDKPVKYRNQTYLAEVCLLAECNSLLSRGGSGDLFSMILKENDFEYIL